MNVPHTDWPGATVIASTNSRRVMIFEPSASAAAKIVSIVRSRSSSAEEAGVSHLIAGGGGLAALRCAPCV